MQKESVREVNGRSSNDRSSRAPEDRNSGRGYDDRSRERDDRDSSGRGYNDRSSRGPEDRSSGPYDRSGRDPYGSGASNDRDGRKFGGGDSRGGYDDRGRGDLTREEGGGGNVAVVQVPDVCAGHLIGKLGSKMKEIQAKYNIMLQIPSTFDPGTGMRSVTITDHGGGQVAACVKEIHGVIAMALQLDRSQKEIAVTPSIAIDGSNILLTNPFAVALDFYEKYRHFRLTEEDLMKIFTTFAKKSEKLLPGLSKKYKLPVAKSITMNRLARLLALYPVPQPYRDTILKNLKEKLPATIDIDSLLRYDLTEDIYSITFDAANCIQKGRIIAADTTIKPLDNISKVRLMLQNNNEKLSTDRSIISRAKDVMKKKKQEHYFDLIVESSVKMKKVKPGLDTPLMLLKVSEFAVICVNE